MAAQRADCEALAAKHGHTIVSVHTDNDLSAYTGKPRPGYRALMHDIEAGQVDVVLAWHTDRLHRSPAELEDYAKVCGQHGVTTLTVKAGPLDLSNASGLLVARMLGNVARYEVDHMVERQQRAKLRSAEAGVWKGGRRPFGYEADGVTPRPAEAAALREVADAVLAGESLGSVTRRWNEAGLTTTTGRPWDMTGVRRTLLRPRNAGLMEHRGKVVGDAQWPAVIDRETWQALRHLLDSPARRTTPGPERRWLGSGLYRCVMCGETVVATQNRGRRCYRCRAGHVTRTQAEVDQYVSGLIVARLRRGDARGLLMARTDPDEGERLSGQVVQMRTRLDELAALFAAGDIDGPQLKAASATLREKLDEAEGALAARVRGDAVASLVAAPDPGQAWLDAPLGRQRAVLDALMKVTLHKSGKGRPAGWKPGESYFRPQTVAIEWRAGA